MPGGWAHKSCGGATAAAVARQWPGGGAAALFVVVIVVAEITAFAVRAEVKVFAVVAFVAQ